jgi:CXXX repeat modification system protein
MAKSRMQKAVEPNAAPSGGVAIAGVATPGRKRVGQVTAEERDEIRGLFERKNALLELAKSLSASSEIGSALYEKIVADLGPVSTKFSAWWAQKGAKYQWERTPAGRWEIDFDTCEIYLIG